MSADKRTVSTDALETLGMIHTREEKRDAIHLAVLPVEAARPIKPGQHIGINLNGRADYIGTDYIGIADPFLSDFVKEGERFWLVIYPRVITSLRHVWTHPQIGDEFGLSPDPYSGMSESERWIRNWATTIPLDYETIMSGAHDYVHDKRQGGYGEYLCFGGLLEGHYVPDEFWPHYENVRGEKIAEDERGSFFTCAC